MMVLALDSYAGSCVRVYKEIKMEGGGDKQEDNADKLDYILK